MVTRADFDGEVARLGEDLLWTEKTHFAAAERLERRHYVLGGVATVAATASAGSLLQGQEVVTGGLALLAATLSALLTFTTPLESSRGHLSSARALGALRVELRLTSAAVGRTHLAAAVGWRRVYLIAKRKSELDRDAPGTSRRDFRTARKKICAGHFAHSVDASAG